ncbi:MAG TPA: hypothetical protein VG738_08325 [Chitinophagaceae bacterium]|nr:hypothetical protein [Chitinophagaceae bacterium]
MNVQLPGFVIAGLYKDTLVITGDADTPQTQQPAQITQIEEADEPKTVQTAQKKWFLGDNKKGIVIVAKDENAVFINEEWLETLSRMLGGLEINLGDTAIVNMHNNPVSFTELKQQLNARHVIMFGVTTTQLGLPFTIPPYQVQNYAGCTLLSAPLETLAGLTATTNAIKAEKRKLWDSLKRISF